MKHSHLLLSGAIIALMVVIKTSGFTFTSQWQHQVFDSYQRLFPREYAPVPVRVVDIDDESLARLGQWPWPREIVARLLKTLHEAGAATVVMDVVFAEADRYSPHRIIEAIPNGKSFFHSSGKPLPDYDALLAEAIQEANGVTGFVLTMKQGESLPSLKSGYAFAGSDPANHAMRFEGAVKTLPRLEQVAVGNGALNSIPDSDGILRRIPLVFSLEGKLYPSLAAEALRVAQGAGSYTIKTSGASGEEDFGAASGITHIKIGAFDIPTTKAGQLWMYYSHAVGEHAVPAWKVLEGVFDKTSIAGNIVFIGTSAAGLKDLRATPLHPAIAGVEVHAEAIRQILSGIFLTRPDWVYGAEIFFIVVAGLLLMGIMSKLPTWWGAAYSLAILALAWGFSLYAFRSLHLLIDPLLPSLAVVLVYMAESFSRYRGTEREKQHIRNAFSHYMSPALVKALAANPERLKLGGEMREMTFLFCDIRGFTAMSERLNAEELTQFINRFLTPMTKVILDHQGTIDKYMGDCIMAFWNAPLDDPGHASHACQAALGMRDALVTLNQSLAIPVQVGIGINTGQCCVGNMGSELRFDYSVIGDDVNLASRLEGQSKTYGVDIIIGETTEEALSGHFATLELDMVRVKGKQQPVRIFTILGDETMKRSFGFTRLTQDFCKFLGYCRAQSWVQAEAMLRVCEQHSQHIEGVDISGLFQHYHQRIAGYREQPLPANWDGVYEAVSK